MGIIVYEINFNKVQSDAESQHYFTNEIAVFVVDLSFQNIEITLKFDHLKDELESKEIQLREAR